MKPGGSRSRAALSVGEGTLSGQVALVTGGTRGLGKEFVRALAAAGAINPTGSRRPLMRRASGDAFGCAISSGPAGSVKE
jgi:NAD(P)-dependent dehydrogenase (short-subunit alcohol dehydrogenase family)